MTVPTAAATVPGGNTAERADDMTVPAADTPPEGSMVPCTLLVVHPSDTSLVVVAATGRPPVAPAFKERYGFTPEALITAARDATGLETFLLRQLPDNDADGHPCPVLAPRDGSVTLADGLAWSTGPTGHPQADAVLAELSGAPVHPLRPAWSRREFLAEVTGWTADRLAAAGTPLTAPLEQVQSWQMSCVWRATTPAGLFYVKATAPSPLFAQEGTATAMVARLFPGQAPTPVAVDPERHWMIVPDLGPELTWKASDEDVLDMIRAFARLQVASAAHVEELLSGGCVERRLPWLVDHVTRWLTGADLSGYVDDPDRAARLRTLAADLPGHLDRLRGFGLPDTLLHGDLHPGNVARAADGYAYFDWSDASVGHPFVDMFTIRRITDPGRREARLAAYLGEWRAFGTPERLHAAWDAADLFTALHHAVSYASIVANLEPPPEPDLHAEVGVWLNHAIDAAARWPLDAREAGQAATAR